MYSMRSRTLLALFALLLLFGDASKAQDDQILIDLNSLDNTTINSTGEYFDMDRIIFLFNDTVDYFTPNVNWSSIYLVILQGEEGNIEDMVDVKLQEAQAPDVNRLNNEYDYTELFSRIEFAATTDLLDGFNIDVSRIDEGMLVNVNEAHPASLGSTLMNDVVIEAALNSSGYIVREHPGYGPRDICIIADDSVINTTACITLYFIGYNDDPPTVNYQPTSNVTFTEGESEHIPIIAGELNVTDPDHPTRYLMHSALVRIEGYRREHAEYLNSTYEHQNISYYYDRDTGVLTVTGNATTDVYTQALSNITYFNGMDEPEGDSRTITITVNDGNYTSNAISVLVIINNTNDVPAISLNGEEVPVNQQLSVNYTEGTLAQQVVPNLVVVDTDPDAMIRRVTVNLTNPIDGMDEEISIAGPYMGLTVSPDVMSHHIEISGVAPKEVYTNVLRTLTYLHSDYLPGNPTTSQPRILTFYVEDDQSAPNTENSVLEINIIAVNNPPILLFVANSTLRENTEPVLASDVEARFTYLEDDPALNFGRDIYLRDVDGNISFATLYMRNLSNGPQDHVYADMTLLETYGVALEIISDNYTTRNIVLNVTNPDGITPFAFEKILRSLSYVNLYRNNSVTDDTRSITIVATDTSGDDSGPITALVTVVDRNDGPVVDVGGGDSMDVIMTFVENGPSIPIAFSHLIDIMDEEQNNISRLTVQLISTNGQLDPTDSIFLRSPMNLPFIDHLDPLPNTTYIEIKLNASVNVYEQALRAVYYDNSELEPTLFINENNSRVNLTRVVVVNITDANFADTGEDVEGIFNEDKGTMTTTVRIGINIKPINDNRPRILLRATPLGCAAGSDEHTDAEESVNRRRRDVRAASKLRKRSVPGDDSLDKAPKLISAEVHLTNVSDSTTCLKNITLTFNVNTSVPIVEVPAKLDRLVSFDLHYLNKARKFGRWMDYRTLSIVFIECVVWNDRTTSPNKRQFSIMFEATRGECDWTTPCSTGICYANNTGCPVTGVYLPTYGDVDSGQEELPEEEGSENDHTRGIPRHYFTTLLVSSGLLLIVIVLSILITLKSRCGKSFSSRKRSTSKIITVEDTAITISPVVFEQQTKEASQEHSHVHDIYPPTTSMKLPNAIPVTDKDSTNNKNVVTHVPDSLSPQHSIQNQKELANATDPTKSPARPAHTTSALSSKQDADIPADHEDRVISSKHLEEGQRVETLSVMESLRKRKKRRGKSKSPKTSHQTSKGDNIELMAPLSDDICSWLQLDTTTEGAQQTPGSCDWSHDHQRTVEKCDSQDSLVKTHQTNEKSEKSRLVPQERTNLHLLAPSQHDSVPGQHTQSQCKH